MADYNNEVVKVENGVLIDINPYAKHILLPKGIEEISLTKNSYYGVGNAKYQVETIKCNKDLKRVANDSFVYFGSLNEISLNEELESIGSGAFAHCSNLKKITIPRNVREIKNSTFYDCSELKEVELPDNLEEIGERAFEDCVKLEKIVLPNKLKVIGSHSFLNCNIKEIEIPKSVEEIGRWAFFGNKELKKIKIHYKNTNTLSKVLSAFCSFDPAISHNIPVTFVFNGPRLDDKRKEKIKSSITFENGDNTSFLFEEIDNILIISDNEIELSNEEIIRDKDIRDLVNKILKISKNSPREIKILVETNLEKDLLKYKQDLLDAKPKFNLRRTNSTFGKNVDLRSYKINLLSRLNSYIFNLASLDNYINDLDEVNKCLELLKVTPQKDGKIIEDNRIDHNIINILINILYLEEKDKTKFLEELENTIISAKDGLSSQIENSFNNNKQIILNEVDYKKGLQLKVSKLYDRVKAISLKRKPFIDLYDVLDNPKEEYTGGKSIGEIINSILYVRAKIKNPEYQTEIYNELNETIKKYKAIVSNTLKNESLMQNTHYDKIELSLRADLQTILEQLNSDVYLDIYEQKNANINDLKKQLERCIRILNGQEIPSSKNKVSNGPIINFLIDVLNELNKNDVIEENDIESIIKELIKILEEIYNKIKDVRFVKLKEYNRILGDILKAIASAKFGIEEYTYDLIDYHKYC